MSREKILHISEVIFQQILAVFVILILWEVFKTYSFSNLHAWHIVMCVFGVALCMAEGVQIYRKESIITFGDGRESKVMGHLIVMTVAFTSITIGIALKIQDRFNASKYHFNSTHSILGLIAWILAFITALGGLAAADYISLPISQRVKKLTHTLLGVTAYIIAIVTLGFGIKHLHIGNSGQVFLIILMVIYVAYSVVGPFKSLLNHIRK